MIHDVFGIDTKNGKEISIILKTFFGWGSRFKQQKTRLGTDGTKLSYEKNFGQA
jgi:hypothetical protein